MDNLNNDKDIPVFDHSFSAFMAGLTIGVASALLLGTKEGRKISQKILSSLSEHLDTNLPDKTQQHATQLSDNISQGVTNIKQTAEKFRENIESLSRPTPPTNIPYNDSGL